MKIERDGILKDVLPEDFLELSGGVIIRNLRDLILALDDMNDDDFGLHVYGEQNDFAEWMVEGYWDDDLVGQVLKIRDRKKLVKLLRKVLDKALKDNALKIGKTGKKKDVLKQIREME